MPYWRSFMRYKFSKDSDKDGINLIKSLIKEDSIKIFIKQQVVDLKLTVLIEDHNKKFEIKLVNSEIFIRRLV